MQDTKPTSYCFEVDEKQDRSDIFPIPPFQPYTNQPSTERNDEVCSGLKGLGECLVNPGGSNPLSVNSEFVGRPCSEEKTIEESPANERAKDSFVGRVLTHNDILMPSDIAESYAQMAMRSSADAVSVWPTAYMAKFMAEKELTNYMINSDCSEDSFVEKRPVQKEQPKDKGSQKKDKVVHGGKSNKKKEYDYKTEGRKEHQVRVKVINSKAKALSNGVLETLAKQKGDNDALKEVIKDQQEAAREVKRQKKALEESKGLVEVYKNSAGTLEFVAFDCSCCRIAYHLTSHEHAIAHQLFGNIITGGSGKDKDVVRKGAVLQIKYVAKQSELYETAEHTWSYECNKMLAHMLDYFDSPFNVLKRSVDYIEVRNRRSFWNICRRAGNTFLDVFRIGPVGAGRSCIYGCINGMGTDISEGVALEKEIEVVKAEPILDFCSNNLDVHVPYGKIEQIGPFVCTPKFYSVGISIGSVGVTIPRAVCSHNELTFYATRQCTVPLYQELPEWPKFKVAGSAKLKAKIKQEYADFCMQAFSELHELLRLPAFELLDARKALDWFLESKPLAYRERLEKGWLKVQESWNMVQPDSVIGRAFGKVEAMCGKERNDVQMRCVTSMTDEYLVESGPLYQLWSKKMLKHLYPDFYTMVSRPVIIATGLSPPQVGDIVTHFEREGFYVAQGDHSRFDGHCEEEMLDAEYWFYEQQGCFPEWHLQLLKAQRCTRSRSKTFKVTHRGKVASGKINTSVGDSLINAAMWVSFAKAHKIDGSVIMVCGDDHIVFTKDYFPAQEYNEWCRRLGHKNSFEWLTQLKDSFKPKYETDYDNVNFCSSWFPVINRNGDRLMHLLAGKAMVKSFIPIKPLPVGKTMDDHVSDVAVGFGYYDFSPVFGAVNQLLRKGRAIKPKTMDYQFVMKEPVEVDPEIMALSFSRRYGFDPSALHNAILKLQLPEGLGVDIRHPLLDRMAEVDGVLIPPQ